LEDRAMMSTVSLVNDRRAFGVGAPAQPRTVRRGLVLVGVAVVQLLLIVGVVMTSLGLAAGAGGGARVGPDRPPAPVVHPEPGF
jgi:hypothetical protein